MTSFWLQIDEIFFIKQRKRWYFLCQDAISLPLGALHQKGHLIVTKPLMQCNSHAIRFIYFCGRFITHKKIYEKGY